MIRIINVTDDEGETHAINAAFVLSVKPRPRTALGSVIRFGNGTSMNIAEGMLNVVAQLTRAANPNSTSE